MPKVCRKALLFFCRLLRKHLGHRRFLRSGFVGPIFCWKNLSDSRFLCLRQGLLRGGLGSGRSFCRAFRRGHPGIRGLPDLPGGSIVRRIFRKRLCQHRFRDGGNACRLSRGLPKEHGQYHGGSSRHDAAAPPKCRCAFFAPRHAVKDCVPQPFRCAFLIFLQERGKLVCPVFTHVPSNILLSAFRAAPSHGNTARPTNPP